jgi:hypothetical protein
MAMIAPSKMLQTSATTIPTITRMPPIVMPPILRSPRTVMSVLPGYQLFACRPQIRAARITIPAVGERQTGGRSQRIPGDERRRGSPRSSRARLLAVPRERGETPTLHAPSDLAGWSGGVTIGRAGTARLAKYASHVHRMGIRRGDARRSRHHCRPRRRLPRRRVAQTQRRLAPSGRGNFRLRQGQRRAPPRPTTPASALGSAL